jgi:hypothetical protein
MTPLDLPALEATARAATPGPWDVDDDGDRSSIETSDGFAVASMAEHKSMHTIRAHGRSDSIEDARHIAAFSPSVALALLAQLRAAQAETELLRTDGRKLVGMLERISVALNEAGWPSSALGVEDRAVSAIGQLRAAGERVEQFEDEQRTMDRRFVERAEQREALRDRVRELEMDLREACSLAEAADHAGLLDARIAELRRRSGEPIISSLLTDEMLAEGGTVKRE